MPSQVSVRATTVISDGNIALWHDIAMTQPVTGDPALRWGVVFTQPPLRRVDLNSERSLYIQNTSQYWLIPIDPCRRLIRSTDNGDIGFIHADMWNLSGEYRGDTCNDIRLRFELGWLMAPGEKWQMLPEPHFRQLASGDHPFDLVFGAIGTSDVANAPISAQADHSALGPDRHPRPPSE